VLKLAKCFINLNAKLGGKAGVFITGTSSRNSGSFEQKDCGVEVAATGYL